MIAMNASNLNWQAGKFGLLNSRLRVEAISEAVREWRHLWQPVYCAPLAHYSVWH